MTAPLFLPGSMKLHNLLHYGPPLLAMVVSTLQSFHIIMAPGIRGRPPQPRFEIIRMRPEVHLAFIITLLDFMYLGKVVEFHLSLILMGLCIIWDGFFWWGYHFDHEAFCRITVGLATAYWGWWELIACRCPKRIGNRLMEEWIQDGLFGDAWI